MSKRLGGLIRYGLDAEHDVRSAAHVLNPSTTDCMAWRHTARAREDYVFPLPDFRLALCECDVML